MQRQEHFPGPISAMLLVMSALMLSTMAILMQLDPGSPSETVDAGVFGIGMALGFGITASLAARIVPDPQAERLGLRAIPMRHVPMLVALLPCVILGSELDNWLTTLGWASLPEDAAELSAAAMRELTPLAMLQTAIAMVGLLPVVAEFLFRGVIQQGVIAYIGRFGGILFASILSVFAFTPLVGASPTGFGVTVVLLCTVLGVVRVATGSLLATIALHAGWNAIGAAALFTRDSFPIQGINVAETHTNPALIGISLACVVWACIQLNAALIEQPVTLPIPEPEEPEEEDSFF